MTLRRRQWVGVFIFALMFGHLGVNAYSAWLKLERLSGSYDGWTARLQDGRAEIVATDANGPATALQPGDEFVSLNGVTLRDDRNILNYGLRVPRGTEYAMVVRRQGQLLELRLLTAAHPITRWIVPIADILVQLLFLLTGLTVFLLKSADRQAWLLALMLCTFTGLFNADLPPVPGMLVVMTGLARIVGLLFLPIFFHFFLIFPDRSPLLIRFPRLEKWLYWPFYLILPWFSLTRIATVLRAQKGWDGLIRDSWLQKYSWLGVIAMAIAMSYLVVALWALLVAYRSAGVAARRKLIVVMAGSGAGATNLLLLVIWESFFRVKFPNARDWIEPAMKFTLPLIPLSFAYAIIRHRVIPVSLIIRRGVRYLLVSRGSIVLHLGLAGVVMFFLMDAFFTQMPSMSGRTVGVISAIVGIAVWNVNHWFHRRVLAPAIDRRFFRQSYDAQQIISDLTNELRSVTSLPHLLELFSIKIQSALKTENVTVFLRHREASDYHSYFSSDYDLVEGRAVNHQRNCWLPRDGQVVAQLTHLAAPYDVELKMVDDWQDLRTLDEVKSSLLLPLATKNELLGIVSLGPRLGDLPFSSEDKKLLMSVAGPTTFAIENARLVERMVEEARRREEVEAENEQRAKEMEEARQLQLSMLPKTIPQLPHLEVAAYMKTATEVGGDYYDFNLADNGELTVVVGDATGHGLKAGTVVTAAKSLFNHLAETPDVTEFFYHSSRALKRMNLRSLFMAMTVARFNGHTVTLSSAGMPPALIYRAKTGEIEEIPLTGVPLGSMTGYRYQQQQVLISSGDVVVLMSDGFPERFNQEGEMLDYWRAKDSLTEVADRSSQEIIQHFVGVGEAWAEGKQQEDDVTFVVLKVK